MLIIGEKINTSRKSIDDAVRGKDAAAIQREAALQVDAGAGMLDVNCGTLNTDQEPAALQWLVRTVQEKVTAPLCIDSPNPRALEAGLAVHRGKAMVNSISGEKDRYQSILPLVKRYHSSVVVLCLDSRGIPPDKSGALELGRRLVEDLVNDGIALEDIYFDPLVRSLATDPLAVLDSLDLVKELSGHYKGLNFISGLSNVSYGLPERRHLNRAFAVLSLAAGMNALIMDPLDENLSGLIHAAEALLNKDRFCLNYIKAYHQGKLSAK
ncbi:MAG: dihydropteroate synthase [Desulfobacterales bacterium]|nr:dihydropteroate synthase [Desulfobacterales bacterium]